MKKYESGCIVCGKELIYSNKSEKRSCLFCKNQFESDVQCPDGHYICDHCHSSSSNDLIKRYCLTTQLTDPLEMAIEIAKFPGFKMHGPEHHFLVPAVLLAACWNSNQMDIDKEELLTKAKNRADKVLGGFCGSHGSCGAGMGAGIFMSVLTGSTPLAKEPWRLSNMITSKALYQIALHGGPRCCKRDIFLSIQESVEFVNKNFAPLTLSCQKEIQCDFFGLNKQCLEKECPFFKS